MQITFTANGNDYSATLWNKVAGKERFYIKNAAGAEFAVSNADGSDVSKVKGAWGSPAVRSAFSAALQSAILNAVATESETPVVAPTAEVERVIPQAPVFTPAPAVIEFSAEFPAGTKTYR